MTAALFCAVLLAGCLSGPILSDQGQEGPVSVNLTNAANETYEFRVLVVDGPPEEARYYPQYNNRESEWTQFSPAESSVTDYSGVNVTAIRFPPKQTHRHGNYTLMPSETVQTQIDEFETQDIVVVVITRGNRILEMNTVSCNGDLVGLSVNMTRNGSFGGHYCR